MGYKADTSRNYCPRHNKKSTKMQIYGKECYGHVKSPRLCKRRAAIVDTTKYRLYIQGTKLGVHGNPLYLWKEEVAAMQKEHLVRSRNTNVSLEWYFIAGRSIGSMSRPLLCIHHTSWDSTWGRIFVLGVRRAAPAVRTRLLFVCTVGIARLNSSFAELFAARSVMLIEFQWDEQGNNRSFEPSKWGEGDEAESGKRPDCFGTNIRWSGMEIYAYGEE